MSNRKQNIMILSLLLGAFFNSYSIAENMKPLKADANKTRICHPFIYSESFKYYTDIAGAAVIYDACGLTDRTQRQFNNHILYDELKGASPEQIQALKEAYQNTYQNYLKENPIKQLKKNQCSDVQIPRFKYVLDTGEKAVEALINGCNGDFE